MTENLKKFLETVSKNDELYGKFTGATQEDLIAMAKAMGITLTDADFAQPTGELDDDELDAVAGGDECYCALGGGGTKDDDDKTCACVVAGAGYSKTEHERCVCAAAGYGYDN